MSNQVYQMSIDIAANLRARKFPVAVQYGPERVDHEGLESMLLHFQRDSQIGDSLRAIPGARGQPGVRVRDQGVALDVIVQSPLAGARHNEHEELCDLVVDGVLTALDEWAVEAKAGLFDFVELGYVSPQDYNGADRMAGVVYRIRFRVARATLKKDFDGALPPTATVAGTSATTLVTLNGVDKESV